MGRYKEPLPPARTPLMYGYHAERASDLAYFCTNYGATVMDVRADPVSRQPGWGGDELRKLLGERYVGVPAWGNSAHGQRRYGAPAEIQILDWESGLATFHRIWRSGGSTVPLLLCQCSNPFRCHRMELAAGLGKLGIIVTELMMTRAWKASIRAGDEPAFDETDIDETEDQYE